MILVSIGLALCALISGLIAAHYWYQSSVVPIDTGWTRDKPEPVVQELKQLAWNSAFVTAISKSADMNKKAARWTALSVVLSSISAIVGSIMTI